jgi:hypothetical protein
MRLETTANKKAKKTQKKGFSLDNLNIGDWAIVALLVILVFVPDPLDALTLMLPVVEGIALAVFTVVRSIKSLRG